MNKVLVKVFFPRIDEWYEMWIPMNLNIASTISLLSKGINELNDNVIDSKELFILYNKKTGEYYNFNDIVQETNIKNGTELILI